MLKLENISKTFRGKPVIKDFSLALAKGDLVCLTGPSGAGKTTIVRIAAGLLSPDGGRRSIGTEHIACAFQDTPLIPWLTTLQNMHFVLSPRLRGRQREERALAWIEKLGLTAALDKKPAEMSGGMQRRLSIACGFAGEPELLFLDEPFAFLDESWQAVVVDELIRQNRQRNLTVLMVSHQPEPVRRLDARVVCLEPGGKSEPISAKEQPGTANPGRAPLNGHGKGPEKPVTRPCLPAPPNFTARSGVSPAALSRQSERPT